MPHLKKNHNFIMHSKEKYPIFKNSLYYVKISKKKKMHNCFKKKFCTQHIYFRTLHFIPVVTW